MLYLAVIVLVLPCNSARDYFISRYSKGDVIDFDIFDPSTTCTDIGAFRLHNETCKCFGSTTFFTDSIDGKNKCANGFQECAVKSESSRAGIPLVDTNKDTGMDLENTHNCPSLPQRLSFSVWNHTTNDFTQVDGVGSSNVFFISKDSGGGTIHTYHIAITGSTLPKELHGHVLKMSMTICNINVCMLLKLDGRQAWSPPRMEPSTSIQLTSSTQFLSSSITSSINPTPSLMTTLSTVSSSSPSKSSSMISSSTVHSKPSASTSIVKLTSSTLVMPLHSSSKMSSSSTSTSSTINLQSFRSAMHSSQILPVQSTLKKSTIGPSSSAKTSPSSSMVPTTPPFATLPNTPKSGVSRELVLGISIPAIIIFLLLCLLCCCCFVKRRKKRESEDIVTTSVVYQNGFSGEALAFENPRYEEFEGTHRVVLPQSLYSDVIVNNFGAAGPDNYGYESPSLHTTFANEVPKLKGLRAKRHPPSSGVTRQISVPNVYETSPPKRR